MARKRIKSKIKKFILSENQYWDLILCDSWIPYSFRESFKSEEQRKLAWLVHKDEIMTEWIEEMNGRPGAWWQYESGLGHFPHYDSKTEEEYLRAGKLVEEGN